MIVDHENFKTFYALNGRSRFLSLLLSSHAWQSDNEFGAVSRAVACGSDVSAMHFDQTLYQAQSEAKPSLQSRPAIELPIHFKDFGQHLCGNSHSRVFDGYH